MERSKVRMFLFAALAGCCGQQAMGSTVTIDLANVGQYINVMGGDMERSAGVLDNATNPQEIANWLYKDIPNMMYCRVSYDRKQELTEGSPNLAFYDKAISAMKKVKIANPTIKFWATLKSDYDGYGTVNNLPDWIYTGGGYDGGTYDPTLVNTYKYARFLADYLKYMNDNGVPIFIMSVSKEWQQVMDYTREKQTIDYLKARLATSDYSGVPVPKFVGPASWGTVQGGTFIGQVDAANYEDRYTGFCVHNYDGPTETQWGTTIAKAAVAGGRACWNDENGDGAQGMYYSAEPPIGAALGRYTARCQQYRQGMKGEMPFEQWCGDAKYSKAICFGTGTAGVRMRGYYILKKWATSMSKAYYVPSTLVSMTDCDAMVFKKDKSVTIWQINSSTTAAKYPTIKLTGGTIKSGTTISKTIWNESQPSTGTTSTYSPTSTTSFVGAIGASSIAAYTFTID